MDKNNEPTNHEILSAINDFASHVEQRFEGVDKKFEGIEQRFNKIESQMVTKDYLDEKLSDLRGDLVILTRKEDVKVRKLIEIMQRHNLLNQEEVKEILSMEPFPQLYL